MSSRSIVNIINVVRGTEPRCPDLDLVEPVVNQIRLAHEHGLPATWLVQYHAMMDERFVSLLQGIDDACEAGVWLEVVRPLVEKAGIEWRGMESQVWDWHADVGFTIGYTPEDRRRLIDVLMADFRELFGDYPKSVGSWFIDAGTLSYMAERYGVVASCNCKDQWGTDGYTLWGGYYSGGYYPSDVNSFIPAQSADRQIPVPVFRMLGSDPIYQYSQTADANGAQGVVTLEPACRVGGGSPKWVQWFFDTMTGPGSISFGYCQVGQENSFGWPAMKQGLECQMEIIAREVRDGRLRADTLRGMGEWFRSTYNTTPASAVVALDDWMNEGRKCVWYSSRFYRSNVFLEHNRIRVRDLHLFDESYAERYLGAACASHSSVYHALPVVDGSGCRGRVGGIRLVGWRIPALGRRWSSSICEWRNEKQPDRRVRLELQEVHSDRLLAGRGDVRGGVRGFERGVGD